MAVNKTNLQGKFACNVKTGDGADNDFLERLRDTVQLNIAREQRRVQMLLPNAR